MQSLNDVRSAETSLKPDNAPWRTVAAGTRESGIADDRIASQADEAPLGHREYRSRVPWGREEDGPAAVGRTRWNGSSRRSVAAQWGWITGTSPRCSTIGRKSRSENSNGIPSSIQNEPMTTSTVLRTVTPALRNAR